LYADDIVFISDSEEKLQIMLTFLNDWCLKWCLNINVLKSSIIHFRHKNVKRTNCKFQCGTQPLDMVDRYTYLGISLDEHMTFAHSIKSQYNKGSRALSAIIKQYNVYMNFTFDIYLQLYDTSVVPAMLYGSEVWGYIKSKDIENIQKRAIRYFMGVHKSTPIPAMMGETGWTPIYIKQSINMIRFWNRVIKMDISRVTKRIFMWDFKLQNPSWNNNVWNILNSISCEHIYKQQHVCDILVIQRKLMDTFTEEWQLNVDKMAKLRTFKLFKNVYLAESYILYNMSRRRRSLMSQFRCGILPLEIETGRYTPIYDKTEKKNRKRTALERLCKICKSNEIEDELHFLCIFKVSYSQKKFIICTCC